MVKPRNHIHMPLKQRGEKQLGGGTEKTHHSLGHFWQKPLFQVLRQRIICLSNPASPCTLPLLPSSGINRACPESAWPDSPCRYQLSLNSQAWMGKTKDSTKREGYYLDLFLKSNPAGFEGQTGAANVIITNAEIKPMNDLAEAFARDPNCVA